MGRQSFKRGKMPKREHLNHHYTVLSHGNLNPDKAKIMTNRTTWRPREITTLLIAVGDDTKTTKQILDEYNKKAKAYGFVQRSFHQVQFRIRMLRRQGRIRRRTK